MIVSTCRIHYRCSEKYKSWFPKKPPYIIDPANPFNNVYKSGIKRCEPAVPDDGKWTNFVKHIDSLDLSIPLEQNWSTIDMYRPLINHHFGNNKIYCIYFVPPFMVYYVSFHYRNFLYAYTYYIAYLYALMFINISIFINHKYLPFPP